MKHNLIASGMDLFNKCPYAYHYYKTIKSEYSGQACNGIKKHGLIANAIKTGECDDSVKQVYDWVKPLLTDYVLVESKVSYNEIFDVDPNQAYGYADLITFSNETKELNVIDFKFGDYPVNVENNTQLLLYAYGALKQFDAEIVNIHIAQPSQQELKSQQFTKQDFLNVIDKKFSKNAKKFKTFFELSDLSVLNQNTGSHCSFCRGCDICEANSNLLVL